MQISRSPTLCAYQRISLSSLLLVKAFMCETPNQLELGKHEWKAPKLEFKKANLKSFKDSLDIQSLKELKAERAKEAKDFDLKCQHYQNDIGAYSSKVRTPSDRVSMCKLYSVMVGVFREVLKDKKYVMPVGASAGAGRRAQEGQGQQAGGDD